MSKGLEEFKHIVDIVDFYTKEKKYYDMRFFPQCEEKIWLETIEKELKALEIIKENKVDIVRLLNRENLDEYVLGLQLSEGRKELTQEEYDLLKEVLL